MPEDTKDAMSREQADSAADALLKAALEKQTHDAEQLTRSLVKMYPGLSVVPPMERHAALAQARESVKHTTIPRLLLAVIGLVVAVAAALWINGHVSLAIGACAVAVGVGIVRQFAELFLVRRHLQRPR